MLHIEFVEDENLTLYHKTVRCFTYMYVMTATSIKGTSCDTGAPLIENV